PPATPFQPPRLIAEAGLTLQCREGGPDRNATTPRWELASFAGIPGRFPGLRAGTVALSPSPDFAGRALFQAVNALGVASRKPYRFFVYARATPRAPAQVRGNLRRPGKNLLKGCECSACVPV